MDEGEIPEKKYFHNASFNEATRTFNGVIKWTGS